MLRRKFENAAEIALGTFHLAHDLRPRRGLVHRASNANTGTYGVAIKGLCRLASLRCAAMVQPIVPRDCCITKTQRRPVRICPRKYSRKPRLAGWGERPNC